MDKILWIVAVLCLLIFLNSFKVRKGYMFICFIISLLVIFRDSYLEILLFFIEIVLPILISLVVGYYIMKYKSMMHGGGYSSYSFNYTKYENSKNKKENSNKKESNKNYGEGTLKEYYDELGVDYSVSDEVLKKNHKKLARIYHPDMNQDKGEKEIKIMEEKLKRINEAYEKIKEYRGII